MNEMLGFLLEEKWKLNYISVEFIKKKKKKLNFELVLKSLFQ